MTRTAVFLLLSTGVAAAQTPPTAPGPPKAKPATKPGDLIPPTLLGRATPYGGNVAGRVLAVAGDGESATFHINPAKTADGKPATTLDQRRGHFGLALGGTVAGDFQYEATLDFQSLPDKVKDGWGVCAGLGLNGPQSAGNAGINRGVFELTGQSYHICRDIPNGSGMTWAYDNLPSRSKTVRLGIRRQGKEAVLLAADGPAEPLAEVRRYGFTDQPVSSLAIYTTTGGSDLPLTLKVSGVKLLTGASLPSAPAKAKTASVVMVPPHDPVPPTTRAVALPLDSATAAEVTASASAPVRGGSWGMPVASGLAGLVVGLLAGRWWGGRTGGDE